MNKPVYILIIALCALFTNHGLTQSASNSEFTRLKEQRDKAVEAAISPIDQKYHEMLKSLLTRATQEGDFSTVTAITEILSAGKAVPDASKQSPEAVEHIDKLVVPNSGRPVLLKGSESITTNASFRPPVEISIEAKTDSSDLRIGYAADQVIFNWREIPHQLRVDGGPANGQHTTGVGLIPRNKYVIIRWVVTPKSQTIYVDGEKRFEHAGDYSTLEKPVSVSSSGSKVSVKSIKVLNLPEMP